jgi:TctA family transporter
MLLATVGIDVVSGTPRFTFGQNELMDGLGFIPVMIGLFGLSEVIRNIGGPAVGPGFAGRREEAGAWIAALRAVWRHKWTAVKSAVTGTFIGALPGAGADIAAWARSEGRTGSRAQARGAGSASSSRWR